MSDPYNLQRFVDAQERPYEKVLNELRAGEKRSHWMWYVFPQFKGLGGSATAQQYAISSEVEAKAYSEHPVLGPRLRECTQLTVNVEGRTVEEIFYYPDNLKFRSCMTLFQRCATDNAVFQEALLKYFAGEPDQLTLDLLAAQS